MFHITKVLLPIPVFASGMNVLSVYFSLQGMKMLRNEKSRSSSFILTHVKRRNTKSNAERVQQHGYYTHG